MGNGHLCKACFDIDGEAVIAGTVLLGMSSNIDAVADGKGPGWRRQHDRVVSPGVETYKL